MRLLYLDAASGLGGDMFLSSLADLGLDLAPLARAFAKAGLDISIATSDKSVCGILGKHLELGFPPEEPHDRPGHGHQHGHGHGHHHGRGYRHLADLTAIIDRLDVGSDVRGRSIAALRRLAEVEAEVHNIAVEKVHFHEVGALDTLVDVVGAFWALGSLGVAEVVCSPLPWFRGFVQCEHGRLPLPAPATARLLQGKPVYPTAIEREIITPTGALIIDRAVSRFAPGPEGTVLASGIGFGTMEIEGHFNGLRSFLLETDTKQDDRHDASGLRTEKVWVLESNVDHLTGEETGSFFQALLDTGALDVAFMPAVMKKNRPGGVLQVMCAPDDLDRVQAAFLKHSLTLGVRRSLVERVVLPRDKGSIASPWGDIEAKAMNFDGQTYLRPEFESLLALSRKTGRSVAELRYLLEAMDDLPDGD